jgi:hypothetical protein
VALVLGVATAVVTTASAAPVAQESSTAAPKRCPKGSVAGTVAGKRACLKPGQTCKRALDQQYHRYGFHCHSGRLTKTAKPPPPPYVGPVTSGSYRGQTQHGSPVFLTVRSDRTFTGWLVVDALPNTCGYLLPGGDLFVDATFGIRDDGTFDARRAGGVPGWTVLYEGGQLERWEGQITGRFDTATSVSGTISVVYDLEHRTPEGPVHLSCRSGPLGPIRWSATLRPPPVASVTPGAYQGRTVNGNPVFLTVRSDRTFTGWLVVNDVPNNCLWWLGPSAYYPGGEWFVDTTISIRDDGTFDAQPRWEGSIPSPYEGVELTHWEGRIAGRFDTATVSGTIIMNYTFENQIGPLPCATQYMTWSATLRA